MRNIFDPNICAKIVEQVADGSSIADAAEGVGISPKTAHNWASEGRRNPAGRYGRFAQDLDAARNGVRLDREQEEGHQPGPVEREVGALIAGRALDAHGRIAAAEGRALAQQIDTLAARGTGSAALGMATASRRLEDVLASLKLQPEDELTKIGRERAARLAALGNGEVLHAVS